MPPWRENPYLVVCLPRATKLKTEAYKRGEFRRNKCKRVAHEGQIYNKNSKFWHYSHISAPINVKFGTGERTAAKFPVYRGNVSRKTYFWTTE